MITLKTPIELEVMKRGGKITAEVLAEVLAAVRPGRSLLELEEIAAVGINRRGGAPAFARVPGYRFATCLNVNEGVVHGIPTARKLVEGDLLSVDLGTYYQGFNTDASWTVYVGERKKSSPKKTRFLRTGEEALEKAISSARPGRRIGEISAAMQRVLEQSGYRPVRTLVGHGIGKELHEEPQIPCLVLRDPGPELAAGMTLAIEVIYTEGSPDLEIAADGWTVETRDRGLSALFEQTVAVTKKGPIILTDSASEARRTG